VQENGCFSSWQSLDPRRGWGRLEEIADDEDDEDDDEDEDDQHILIVSK